MIQATADSTYSRRRQTVVYSYNSGSSSAPISKEDFQPKSGKTTVSGFLLELALVGHIPLPATANVDHSITQSALTEWCSRKRGVLPIKYIRGIFLEFVESRRIRDSDLPPPPPPTRQTILTVVSRGTRTKSSHNVSSAPRSNMSYAKSARFGLQIHSWGLCGTTC